MTDGGGNISREDFVDYAKKSAAVKELTDKGFALVGKQPSGAATKASLDKAELAFKVGFFTSLSPSVKACALLCNDCNHRQ